MQVAFAESGSADLVIAAVGGLILVFSLWWLYFKRPAEISLRARTINPFAWGYGHYLMFAAIAAVGAGIGALVELHHESGDALRAARLILAGAVGIYLLVLTAVRWAESHDRAAVLRYVAGVIAVLVVGFLGLDAGATVLACGIVAAATLTWQLWAASRGAREDRQSSPQA